MNKRVLSTCAILFLILHACIREDVLMPPDITTLSKQEVVSGEILTISGSNFDPSSVHFNIGNDIVQIAGTPTLTQASIIVPFVDQRTEVSITANTKFGRSSPFSLTILPPSPIISKVIPAMGGIGSIIKIAGKFFGANPNVFFQSNGSATAISAVVEIIHADTLRVTVPAGLAKDAAGILVSSASGSSTLSAFTVLYPAEITSFSPESGVPGDKVLVAGSGLSFTEKVFVGSVAAELVSSVDNKIQFIIPPGAVSDTIKIHSAAGVAKTAKKLMIVPAPEITAVDKLSGSPGMEVTITGNNFQNVLEVKFGTIPAAITSSTNTQIKTTIPEKAGSGKISVTTPAGTGFSAQDFLVVGTPFISAFSPVVASVGQKVTLSGINFGAAPSTPRLVSIGIVNVTAISSWTDTSIEFTVPAAATSGKITVTAPGGMFETTTQLTISGSAKITSVSPLSGVPGTSVTIKGENFKSDPQIFFHNNVKATAISKATSTEIICQVPVGATTGKIVVDNAQSSADFAISLNPTITGFSPVRGGENTEVTITGKYLTGAVIRFSNNVTATKISGTDTQAVVRVPASAITGKISATTTAGSVSSVSDFEILSPPTITSFSPASGIAGTPVTLTGTNFQHNAEVRFSPNALAVIKSVTPTQIVVEVPATASTGKISVKTDAASTHVSSTGNFTVINKPAILSLSPTSGTIGQKVVITGSDFDNVVSVSFDGVFTNEFISKTATRLEVRVPLKVSALSSRSINVNVTTTAGTSGNSSFIVLATPQIYESRPKDNPHTWALIIEGYELSTVNRVTINGADATIDYKASWAITTRVPANATVGNGEIRLYHTDMHYVSAPYIVLAAPPPGVFPPPFFIIPPPPPVGFIPTAIDAEWYQPYGVDQTIDMRTDDKDSNGKYLQSGSITARSFYYGNDYETSLLIHNQWGYGGWDGSRIWISFSHGYYTGIFNSNSQIVLTNSETGRQMLLGAPCNNFPSCK